MTGLPSRSERAALSMLAAWMGERYFRTFRRSDEDPGPFDALLSQRERRVGVTIGPLWDEDDPPSFEPPGVAEFERMVTSDLEDGGGYVLWVPPGGELPADEPQRSELRLRVSNGLKGLAPGERRELRLPVRLYLAKIQDSGAYVSVSGGLSSVWTDMSTGVEGAFHLDSLAIHRLPEEQAEVDIIISRVRDRAALLSTGELTEVDVHDHWLVSRLAADEPAGLTVIAAPPAVVAGDGAAVRRVFRRRIRRASEQREAGECDFCVLLLVASPAHIGDEMATAALRGMSPTAYGSLDLIALAGDGQVRQVLQPRSLPWES